jgi:hypothetical protein
MLGPTPLPFIKTAAIRQPGLFDYGHRLREETTPLLEPWLMSLRSSGPLDLGIDRHAHLERSLNLQRAARPAGWMTGSIQDPQNVEKYCLSRFDRTSPPTYKRPVISTSAKGMPCRTK